MRYPLDGFLKDYRKNKDLYNGGLSLAAVAWVVILGVAVLFSGGLLLPLAVIAFVILAKSK